MFQSAMIPVLLGIYSVNPARDWLVALVALGLGINIVYAVLTENDRCFELASIRALERRLGRMATRWILFGLGGLCILMAAYLIVPKFWKPRAGVSINTSQEMKSLAGVGTISSR